MADKKHWTPSKHIFCWKLVKKARQTFVAESLLEHDRNRQ